jgi:hypothetical protein
LDSNSHEQRKNSLGFITCELYQRGRSTSVGRLSSTRPERPAVTRVILPLHNSAVFFLGANIHHFARKINFQKRIFCLHSLFLKKVRQKTRTKFF